MKGKCIISLHHNHHMKVHHWISNLCCIPFHGFRKFKCKLESTTYNQPWIPQAQKVSTLVHEGLYLRLGFFDAIISFTLYLHRQGIDYICLYYSSLWYGSPLPSSYPLFPYPIWGLQYHIMSYTIPPPPLFPPFHYLRSPFPHIPYSPTPYHVYHKTIQGIQCLIFVLTKTR